VKSRLLDDQFEADNLRRLTFQATIISNGELPIQPAPMGNDGQAAGQGVRTMRPDRRLARQGERLRSAFAVQTAMPGDVVPVGNLPLMTCILETDDQRHAEVMRRIARKARRHGFGAEVVEDSFLYFAIFDHQLDEIDGPRSATLAQELPAMLATSKMFETRNKARNALILQFIPDEREEGPQLYLPYFLYSLPRATIIDLLYGRMQLGVAFNPGKLEEALEDEGFTVTAQKHTSRAPGSFYISKNIDGPNGATYVAELHELSGKIREIVMEFRPLESLIGVANKMAEAAGVALSQMDGVA
jgi:hypothetical protein